MCPQLSTTRFRQAIGRVVLWVFIAICVPGCLYSPAEPGERRTGVDDVGSVDSTATLQVGTATRARSSADSANRRKSARAVV